MGSLWRHPRRSAYAGGTEPSRLDTRWKRVDAGDTFDVLKSGKSCFSSLYMGRRKPSSISGPIRRDVVYFPPLDQERNVVQKQVVAA
jgi:hypothetical protein